MPGVGKLRASSTRRRKQGSFSRIWYLDLRLTNVRRQAINDGNLIYIPAHDSSPAMWTSSDRCLWNAREDMQTAYPLAHLYRTVFHRSEEDLDVLRQFFKTALGVKDSSWEDYLNEMRRLKDLKSEDFDWINDLYSSLDSERFGMMEVDTTKLRYKLSPFSHFQLTDI